MSFDFSLIAERKIQEAIEEGAFDFLPGKGKPLVLDDLPPHLRILRNAGVLPDWMQMHLDVGRERQECARLWERTAREYERRRARLDTARSADAHAEFARWLARSRQAYLEALRRVNSDILKLNLKAPAALPEHPPFRMAEETARFDAFFLPPAEAATPPLASIEDRPEGGLRRAARDRYRHGGRP